MKIIIHEHQASSSSNQEMIDLMSMMKEMQNSILALNKKIHKMKKKNKQQHSHTAVCTDDFTDLCADDFTDLCADDFSLRNFENPIPMVVSSVSSIPPPRVNTHIRYEYLDEVVVSPPKSNIEKTRETESIVNHAFNDIKNEPIELCITELEYKEEEIKKSNKRKIKKSNKWKRKTMN